MQHRTVRNEAAARNQPPPLPPKPGAEHLVPVGKSGMLGPQRGAVLLSRGSWGMGGTGQYGADNPLFLGTPPLLAAQPLPQGRGADDLGGGAVRSLYDDFTKASYGGGNEGNGSSALRGPWVRRSAAVHSAGFGSQEDLFMPPSPSVMAAPPWQAPSSPATARPAAGAWDAQLQTIESPLTVRKVTMTGLLSP